MFPEPICKVLVNQKICSSRGARTLFKQGRVTVNGKVVEQHDFAVDVARDDISVDGKLLEKVQHVYLVLNKPVGYVCASASDRHPVVYDLLSSIKLSPFQTLHSVGRLDSETSGLLLLTTNGAFSHFLTAPENHVEKQYAAVLENPVNLQEQARYKKLFASGTVLPAEKKAPESTALPAKLEFISQKECLVTVSEGQFHQIRRMFLGVGNSVAELKRISIGNFRLEDDLLSGQFKFLEKDDLEKLQI